MKRWNLVYTPKHGSWLRLWNEHRAECELSYMTSQCLAGRRIGCLKFLQSEIATWSQKTNAKQRGIDWQFQVEDARTKLKKLYPTIKT